MTPLDVSVEEVKAVLREHGGKHSLFGAASEGMLETVGELIGEGADVNQRNAVSRACNIVQIWCLGRGEMEREMGRQAGIQTDRQTDRRTDRG